MARLEVYQCTLSKVITVYSLQDEVFTVHGVNAAESLQCCAPPTIFCDNGGFTSYTVTASESTGLASSRQSSKRSTAHV